MIESLTVPPPHDQSLEHALSRLVHNGVIDEALAQRIEAERNRDAAAEVLAAQAPPAKAPTRARLPEVLGYLGAAFVVTAGLLVVARFWRQMGLPVRVTVSLTGATALIAVALVVACTTTGGWRRLRSSADAARRRLVGALLVLAAPLTALALGLVLDDADVQTVLLPSALVALAVCAVAVAVAGGVIPTLGVFAAGGLTLAGFGELFDSVSTLAWMVAIVLTAMVWTAVAPRLAGAPTVALSLGLLTLVYVGSFAAQYQIHEGPEVDEFGNTMDFGPVEWGAHAVVPFGYAVLLGVIVVGTALYLRGASWPWIGAAGLAAAVPWERWPRSSSAPSRRSSRSGSCCSGRARCCWSGADGALRAERQPTRCSPSAGATAAASRSPHWRARSSSPSRIGPAVPLTQKLSGGRASRPPSPRSRLAARWAADPGSRGRRTRESNVATGTRTDPLSSPSIHSRIPTPWETTGRAACLAASCRVFGRVMPNACVGPPTTSRSTSAATAEGAAPTSTRSTVIRTDKPSATATATVWVLPNIDSYTTSARFIGPPRRAHRTPASLCDGAEPG